MIVFIGAGVSKLFGIPFTRGFIDIFDKEPDISPSEIYKRIREFGEDTDLELLMTILGDLTEANVFERISPQTTQFLLETFTLQSAKHFVIDDSTRKEARRLLTRMKSIIREKCQSAPFQSKSGILNVYDRFFDMLSKITSEIQSGDGRIKYQRNLEFVTTNYDRCIETYFGERQIPFVQGLVSKYGHEEFDVSSGFRGGGSDYQEVAKIELFKLHGSIDLFNVGGRIRRRVYGEEVGEEVVYYPVEFGGYRHIIESPYLELFHLFRERINQDNQWVIIGSSLRDRTICSIMNDVIKTKREIEHPKVVFVNPDKTITERLNRWGFSFLSKKIHRVEDEFGSDKCNEAIFENLR